MTLKPIKTASMTESAYEALEKAIVCCELGPGTLLSDRRLAQELGISRTPVREALQLLEASGLVSRRGRVGWMVAEFDHEDVRELFELRRVLEPPGLERLAETWDEAAVRELSTHFDDFAGPLSRDRYEEYLKRDHEFHKKIVGWSGNSRLIHFYGIVEKQINRIRHYLAPGYEGRMENVIAEHRRICDAIADHNLAAAHQALIDHLRAGEEAMFDFLREQRLEGASVGEATPAMAGESAERGGLQGS